MSEIRDWSTTLPHRLWEAAENANPEQGLIFVDRRGDDTHYTWATILSRAQQMAGWLQTQGIGMHDRICIVLPTGIEFFDIFFAAQILGAVPVPLYPPLRLGKMDTYVDRTVAMLTAVNAAMLVTNRRVSRVLGRVVERYTPPKGFHILDSIHLNQQSPVTEICPELSTDDLAMAQFSSGTTVAPKPVGLTHRNVLSNTEIISSKVEGNIGCSWLPLYHDMGLIGCIFPAVCKPGTMVLISPEIFLQRPILWLQSISKHRAYISPAPNFSYAYCVQRIKDTDLEGIDLSCWKMALNGAEAVAPKHLRAFQEKFAPVGFHPNALCPVYGLAEASLGVSFTEPTRPFTSKKFDRDALQDGQLIESEDGIELASVGTPLPLCQVEIRNETLECLPEGQIGTIWVHSPSVMQGYLNDAPSPIVDGWLNTGDLGFFFDNELYIYGRQKDVIVLGGQNHAPQDLEMAVDGLDGVRTGCSVAVGHHSDEGEQVYLFVETLKNTEIPTDLAEQCKSAVSKETGIQCDLVVLVPSGTLPRTSSGKLRRSESLRLFLTGNLLPPKEMTTFTMAGLLAQSWLGHWKARRRR